MAYPRWDRLLETCYRRKASDLLFIPGSPPMIRTELSWRTLAIPPFLIEDLKALVAELMPVEHGQADGFAYHDFWHGNCAYFRIMAFGYPETRAVVVCKRIPPSPP